MTSDTYSKVTSDGKVITARQFNLEQETEISSYIVGGVKQDAMAMDFDTFKL